MRPLSVLVAVLSVAQALSALLFVGPHSDVPGQPVTSLVVIAAALGGVGLARALWRGRSAARALAAWGLGVALWVLGLVVVIASPAERRDAWTPLAIGLSLWAAFIVSSAWRVGQRIRTTGGPSERS